MGSQLGVGPKAGEREAEEEEWASSARHLPLLRLSRPIVSPMD